MIQELSAAPAPKLVVAIIDRNDGGKLEDILHEKHSIFHCLFHGTGTASSEILNTFGLSGTEKTICICVEPHFKVYPLLTAITERLEMTRPGNGIVFSIPISGISSTISNAFSKLVEQNKERRAEYVEKEIDTANEANFELVVAVVNQGFSDAVMDAAHECGARGGTIVHARRTGIEDAAKFFGISLQSEKEIVAILIAKCVKMDLMQTISKSCGIKTAAQGIMFSLPVQSCAGIDMGET